MLLFCRAAMSPDFLNTYNFFPIDMQSVLLNRRILHSKLNFLLKTSGIQKYGDLAALFLLFIYFSFLILFISRNIDFKNISGKIEFK